MFTLRALTAASSKLHRFDDCKFISVWSRTLLSMLTNSLASLPRKVLEKCGVVMLRARDDYL